MGESCFSPRKKGAGGKVLAMLKGEHQKCWGSFNAGA